MKKENLIAQLEAAKALTSVVSIDNVIALIQQLEAEVQVEKVFGITQELADDIANKIERCIDNYSSDLVDRDSAEFELSYDNRIELMGADVNVSEIMDHVTACLSSFVEDGETDGFIEAQKEAADSVSVSVINSEALRQDETE